MVIAAHPQNDSAAKRSVISYPGGGVDKSTIASDQVALEGTLREWTENTTPGHYRLTNDFANSPPNIASSDDATWIPPVQGILLFKVDSPRAPHVGLVG